MKRLVKLISCCQDCEHAGLGHVISHLGFCLFHMIQCKHPEIPFEFSWKKENQICPIEDTPIPKWCPLEDAP